MTRGAWADPRRLLVCLCALVAVLLSLAPGTPGVAALLHPVTASSLEAASGPTFRDADPDRHERAALSSAGDVDDDDDDDLSAVLMVSPSPTAADGRAAMRAAIEAPLSPTPGALVETHRAARGPPRRAA